MIDWPNQQAICPEGKTSVIWSPRCDERGQDIIEVRFAKADCASCSSRPLCTQAQRNPRSLKIRQPAQRAVAWLQQKPLAQTRRSAFAALASTS